MPDGLWLQCPCGQEIDVLDQVDRNSATIEEAGKRFLASSRWLMTVLKCPSCGRRVMLEINEAEDGYVVTDPLGRQVTVPVRKTVEGQT